MSRRLWPGFGQIVSYMSCRHKITAQISGFIFLCCFFGFVIKPEPLCSRLVECHHDLIVIGPIWQKMTAQPIGQIAPVGEIESHERAAASGFFQISEFLPARQEESGMHRIAEVTLEVHPMT